MSYETCVELPRQLYVQGGAGQSRGSGRSREKPLTDEHLGENQQDVQIRLGDIVGDVECVGKVECLSDQAPTSLFASFAGGRGLIKTVSRGRRRQRNAQDRLRTSVWVSGALVDGSKGRRTECGLARAPNALKAATATRVGASSSSMFERIHSFRSSHGRKTGR